jgi:hypothetical protein
MSYFSLIITLGETSDLESIMYLQFVFDVITKNAEIRNGGCEHGERYNKDLAEIIMPDNKYEEPEDVLIQAAYAMGHQRVSITPTIVLKPHIEGKPRQGTQLYDENKNNNNNKNDENLRTTNNGKNRIGASSTNGDGDGDGDGNEFSIINFVYSFLWWILGLSVVFGLFAIYGLNSRGGTKMRGSKLNYE